MRIVLALLLVACASTQDRIPTGVAPAPPAAPTAAAPTGTIELTVTDKGFEPAHVAVKKGEPVHLVITRKTDATCAKDIVVPEQGIKQALPLGQRVEVTFTPAKTGELRYGCAMDQMVGGVILVE